MEKFIHPVTKEEYSFKFSKNFNFLVNERKEMFDFANGCNISYIYWNGWFYFKSLEDYATVMLII